MQYTQKNLLFNTSMAFFSGASKEHLFVHINSSAFESMVEFASL